MIHDLRERVARLVSILTRPEGRMLSAVDTAMLAKSIAVSILTRPEGRMLSHIATKLLAASWFQSSPGPKAGCYVRPGC